jgi:hypothetical protein
MMVHPLAAIVAIQDSVAYVAKTSGPPASEAYMWAGYAITLGTLAAYIVLMVRRVGRSRPS